MDTVEGCDEYYLEGLGNRTDCVRFAAGPGLQCVANIDSRCPEDELGKKSDRVEKFVVRSW